MFPEDTTRHKMYYPENSVYNPFNNVVLHSSENIPRDCLKFYFTSQNHNDRRSPSPQPTSVQTGGSNIHPLVLGYTLHPKRVYDVKK